MYGRRFTMGVISLFSGCGGCSLGLRNVGFTVNLAVDIDRDACNTYAANLGRDAVWCADLSKVESNALLARSNLSLDELDLMVGGPPCQGFSSAGAKDWSDPRNILERLAKVLALWNPRCPHERHKDKRATFLATALIRHFVEIITALRPMWFIMENVEGLLTSNNGFFLVESIIRFLEAGY
jgi:DNA (cytosine-5)-methyltransferase 1